ncbi:MAG: glycine--tRNA ligase, partial [Bacteroidales bacterium]|nr:glycine--tRNA ligase [Bacteroidales bacterium]
DAIGTPFCITVDHQSAEDGTVTLRHRDTMEQERVSIDDIERIVTEKCDIKNLLRQLM